MDGCRLRRIAAGADSSVTTTDGRICVGPTSSPSSSHPVPASRPPPCRKVFLKIGPHDTEVKFVKGHQKNMRTGKKHKVRKVAAHQHTAACRPVVYMRSQSFPGATPAFHAVPYDPLLQLCPNFPGSLGYQPPPPPGPQPDRRLQIGEDGFPVYDPALFDPPVAAGTGDLPQNLQLDADGFPVLLFYTCHPLAAVQ